MKTTTAFKEVIEAHLTERAKSDKLFAASFAKKDKNINDCAKFILGEVYKSKTNAWTDDEIFSLAIHYYDEDNIKIQSSPKASVVHTKSEATATKTAKPKTKKPPKAAPETMEYKQLTLF